MRKQENSIYRKNEQDLELLNMKKYSFESEINDNSAKIDNINTELKILTKEITNLDREKNDLELKEDFIELVNDSLEMLLEHAEKEDNSLFPLADKRVNDELMEVIEKEISRVVTY